MAERQGTMTTVSTIIVFHNGDGTVTVSDSIPPGVSMSGYVVERFRVHGQRRLDPFPGTHQMVEYASWKQTQESQGFEFKPFPI
jgi:hypothetical protein